MNRQNYANYDPSLKALTPEGVEFVLTPAGFPVRTAAYVIDVIIQFAFTLVIYIAFIISNQSLGIWIFLLLKFLIDWFYHVICELFFRGQSIGKRLMGLRVVKSDGSPVDPGSSFLRNLLRFADTFFYLYHIAFISIAASSGFRRIGDWAGNTLVVYSSMAKILKRNSLSDLLKNYDICTPSRQLSSEEKTAILNFARRYPLLGEARANEIAGLYAPFIKTENFNNISNAAFLMGITRKLSGEI
ncbi:MAG: RDD family protein [Treponema sp.]|nr:RDD family protein [Treponema sp.]